MLEHLREINRRAAYFRGDLGQRPAPRQIACQHELCPIHEQLASDSSASRVRGAWVERPLHQGQGQAFGIQRFRDVVAQAVTNKRYKHLGSRVNSPSLLVKCERSSVAQERTWRQFQQQRFIDYER